MTKQAVPAQATEDFRGEPPSGTRPERVRVALVAGSGSISADDLYAVLRRRLLTLSWIMTGIFLFVMAVGLVLIQIVPPDEELAPLPSGPYEWVVARCRVARLMLIGLRATFDIRSRFG